MGFVASSPFGGLSLPLPLQEKSLVEIIVVDAGCKDNTMAAVASMKLDLNLRYCTAILYNEEGPDAHIGGEGWTPTPEPPRRRQTEATFTWNGCFAHYQ